MLQYFIKLVNAQSLYHNQSLGQEHFNFTLNMSVIIFQYIYHKKLYWGT